MTGRTGIGWLMVLTLALLLADVAVAQENVARGRPFRCSTDVLGGWTGLVDGVTDSDSAPGCFATGNSNEFPKFVTIDLQRPCEINRVAVHNSANGNTRGIVIYCSEDGGEYEKLREFIFPQNEALTLNHRFNDRPAQFVRVEFANTWGGGLGGDNTIFCREVEVFGTPTGGTPVLEAMEAPHGDALITTRDLRLFRRWALDDTRKLTLSVLGDTLASCEEATWPRMVAEKLSIVQADAAEVAIAAVSDETLGPEPDSGYVARLEDAEPDVVLVTFGTDLEKWDGVHFRAGLTGLVNRLLAETDAVIVLVGPVARDADRVEIGRRALDEMDKLADAFSLPLVRTEVALLREGLAAEDIWDDEDRLTEQARRVLATSVLELLLQPQM